VFVLSQRSGYSRHLCITAVHSQPVHWKKLAAARASALPKDTLRKKSNGRTARGASLCSYKLPFVPAHTRIPVWHLMNGKKGRFLSAIGSKGSFFSDRLVPMP
jgi:hypothetical protein